MKGCFRDIITTFVHIFLEFAVVLKILAVTSDGGSAPSMNGLTGYVQSGSSVLYLCWTEGIKRV